MRLAACLCLSPLIISGGLLTGCALAPATMATPAPEAGSAMSGTVHGGIAPVVGAHVYLMAAGTSGYDGASVSLLNAGLPGGGTDSIGNYVTTDSAGVFTISNDYTCTPGAQIYLLATGGNPGLSGNATNPNLYLVSGVGACPAAGTFAAIYPLVSINEVTTVATVYALSGFMLDALHVSSPNTSQALTGIANAFSNVSLLVNFATGAAYANSTTPLGGYGTVPQAEINTLANIISSCVNTSGASSTPCTTLFSNAVSGTTAPTDTTTAALYIAQNPSANVAALFAITPPPAPFAPALTSAPNDFNIAINYSGGGISTPSAIAIDSVGNAWIANSTGSVTEFSNYGSPVNNSPITGGGLQNPSAIAIDTNNNVWVANDFDPGSLTEIIGANGTVNSSAPFTGGGLFQPEGIAIDKLNNIWLANFGQGEFGSVSKFSNSGTPISGDPAYGPGFGIDVAVAIDESYTVWAVDLYLGSLDRFSGAFGTFNSSSDPGINSPTSLAFDSVGYVWVATDFGALRKFSPDATPFGTFTGGGMNYSRSVAIDGIGNVWVANSGFSLTNPAPVSEFDNEGNAVSPSTGYVNASLIDSNAIAVDPSGDVWVANSGNNSVTEFIGAGAPVVTPLALGLLNGTLATRP